MAERLWLKVWGTPKGLLKAFGRREIVRNWVENGLETAKKQTTKKGKNWQ